MPRSLSAAMVAAIAAKALTLSVFVKLAFADSTYYLFSGVGSITPAGPPSSPSSTFPYGQTFTGLGWLGRISSIPQTTKVQAQNVTVTLSGIPAALVPEATGQVRVAGTMTAWIGLFNASTGALISDPAQVYSGSLDVPTLSDSGETCSISITCENPLLSLNLAPNRQFDDADQQIYHPGDLGFSFVDALANMALFWPAPNTSVSPYPLYMTVTLPSPDLQVGATMPGPTVTVHYSDGSYFSRGPSGTSGGGPNFICSIASTNPKIASFTYAGNTITGVAAGECSIIARAPISTGSGAFQQYRAATSLIVHQ